MGLLDQVMGSMAAGGRPQQKPGLGSTVAAGVILALLVKGVRSYQQSHNQAPGDGRSFNPQDQASRAQAAPAQTGGGLGGLLSGLGGAGALGALVSQFQQKGLGTQVNSWVGPGHNEPVAPEQVAHALGEDNVRQLQEQTGLPRDSLLSELTQVLPQAVH
ncbi:MAG: hypothetical protein JWQ97_3358, partial [Phenylobacterium sp.]|nr:hypothetical protein [Phenylobacterium sp.]